MSLVCALLEIDGDEADERWDVVEVVVDRNKRDDNRDAAIVVADWQRREGPTAYEERQEIKKT